MLYTFGNYLEETYTVSLSKESIAYTRGIMLITLAYTICLQRVPSDFLRHNTDYDYDQNHTMITHDDDQNIKSKDLKIFYRHENQEKKEYINLNVLFRKIF